MGPIDAYDEPLCDKYTTAGVELLFWLILRVLAVVAYGLVMLGERNERDSSLT